jgi:alpha-maltose-1-phosphate synthase
MKTAILTNEFPPNIYGGAGIHVKFLTQELKKYLSLEVRCFGDQNQSEESMTVQGFAPRPLPATEHMKKIFNPLDINLQMAASIEGADLVHCHTWYSHWAGILASTMLHIPLVLSTHSLEPHRPWKKEQLGTGYHMSSWVEQKAYEQAHGIIAVSGGMKKDVVSLYNVDPSRVQVIYNGIDPDFYKPTFDPSVLAKHGIDSNKPFILFVGRITRQKGIVHLLQSIPLLHPDLQVVLCAGAPDTPEIGQEMEILTQAVQQKRPGVIWIKDMLPHEDLRVLYSHAQLFICPSMYEPFGIINLEAMSCGTPVIGSAVGGIPEIIIDGKTGLLVPLEHKSATDFEPLHPAEFHNALAHAINTLHEQPDKITQMGIAGRKRVEDVFTWNSIAKQTKDFYERTLKRFRQEHT